MRARAMAARRWRDGGAMVASGKSVIAPVNARGLLGPACTIQRLPACRYR